MMAASAVLVVMMGFVKLARAELSGAEIVLWRGILSAPLLLLATQRRGLRLRNPRAFAFRLLFGFGAMVTLATAAKGLSLVDLNLIGKLRPILIGAAAPLVLGRGERLRKSEWISVAVGFAGCALIIGGDLAVGSLFGVWAVVSIVFSAAAHISLRALGGGGDDTFAVVFWFHLGIAALAVPTLLISGTGIHLPSGPSWSLLAGVAVTATVSQLLMTRAYSLDTAPAVAAATYAGPLWSLIGDLLVFDLIPGPTVVLGGALVLASSLWLVLRRRAPAPPSGA